MPSNEERRGSRIVEVNKFKREEDLIGGLKNALARGEDLEKAKNSFLNAGYKTQEVEVAIQRIVPQKKEKSGKGKTVLKIELKGGKASKQTKVILVLLIVSILLFIGSAVLGLFWENFFG